jgi:hypothetical protein
VVLLKHRAMSLIAIIKSGLLVSQTWHMMDSKHLEKFCTQLNAVKLAGGDICSNSGMTEGERVRADVVTKAGRDVEVTAATLPGQQRFEPAVFLAKSDRGSRGRLSPELANDFNKGRDSCLASITDACELMPHDVRDQDSKPQQQHSDDGLAFIIVGGMFPEVHTWCFCNIGLTVLH